MHCASEIAFIDPGIDDLHTFLAGLRPEVEAIVLDGMRPATRQVAEALGSRRGLAAIHIVAHGAPGRVCFTSGEWTAATAAREAAELAAVGRAVGPDGEMLLWSCEAGAGAAGELFLDALVRVTGAQTAGAKARVGAAARGGTWELGPRGAAAKQPLTSVGAAEYAGLLMAEVIVTGKLPEGDTTRNVTYFITDAASKTVFGQVMLPDAARGISAVSMIVKIPNAAGAVQIGTFDEAGVFTPAKFLSVSAPGAGRPSGGAMGAWQ